MRGVPLCRHPLRSSGIRSVLVYWPVRNSGAASRVNTGLHPASPFARRIWPISGSLWTRGVPCECLAPSLGRSCASIGRSGKNLVSCRPYPYTSRSPAFKSFLSIPSKYRMRNLYSIGFVCLVSFCIFSLASGHLGLVAFYQSPKTHMRQEHITAKMSAQTKHTPAPWQGGLTIAAAQTVAFAGQTLRAAIAKAEGAK